MKNIRNFCIIAHIDHGKSTLADRLLEKTNTLNQREMQAQVLDDMDLERERGITIKARAVRLSYQAPDGNTYEFNLIDTPGHAAFTAMRARGAQITDVVILEVAADDGIMPQTIEAINHAKAAGVTIVVAINKIDKPEANIDRVKQQLTEHNVIPEEWGGDVICVPISAKHNKNIDGLLESVLLVAEMLELKADSSQVASGTIVESKVDKGRGIVATILIKNGTLKVGDSVIVGTCSGKIRAMTNDKRERIKSAGPSIPVEILGLTEVPNAGDYFEVVQNEKEMTSIIDKRKER